MKNRTLYFGDNLKVLREKFPGDQGYFDLIYLDPPFNSNRNYNVIFKEGLIGDEAQIKAFDDCWHWTLEAKETFEYLIQETNEEIANLMQALGKLLGHNDVLAYLTMMTVRLVELHRVLKPTGSLYLHCDPTASHYLKIVLDVIFGKPHFQNEVIWCYKRWTASAKRYQRLHDVIFFYTKSDAYYFDEVTAIVPYADDEAHYTEKDEQGEYRWQYLNGKKYKLHKKAGVRMGDWWEIPYLNSMAKERLGYPTQKPETLLERIISTSSYQDAWILDPFCGCGTTVAVAERLKRNWVGIDVTTLSINLIKNRIEGQYPNIPIQVDGLPETVEGAKLLFDQDPFEFEYWALSLVDARPGKSKSQGSMKGADKGVDGVYRFSDLSDKENPYKRVIVQVKGGHVQRNQIATLKGDVERERAEGGLFVTLEPPTKPMVHEAIEAGKFTIKFNGQEFPKIQIITIDELLHGKRPDLPHGLSIKYHKEAQKAVIDDRRSLFDDE